MNDRVFQCAAWAVFACMGVGLSASADDVTLRLWTIPETGAVDPRQAANARVLERFRQQHPHVTLRKTAGIQIPQIGASAALLMSIAGGVAPDVLELTGENLPSFVQQGFLIPLDDHLADIPTQQLYERAPRILWDAARMRGPDGKEHLYAIPISYSVSALKIRHDVLKQMGVEESRWPRTWEQLYELARQITASGERRGIGLPRGDGLADVFQTLLIAAGGQPWRKDQQGRLWASFDDDHAVQALDFLWKLSAGPWQHNGQSFHGVAYSDVDMWYSFKRQRYLMALSAIYPAQGMLMGADLERFRLMPVPASPGGAARPRLNATYAGVYAGQTNAAVRQAALDFLLLQGSRAARQIRTEALVEAESGVHADPLDLERFGFDQELARLPPGYVEFFRRSLEDGYLPPAGAGADELRRALLKPIQVVLADSNLASMDESQRRQRMAAILRDAVTNANQRLHQGVPDDQMRRRQFIALLVAAVIFIAFALQLWLVQRTYAARLGASINPSRSEWSRTFKASFILAPALGLILMWEYYPLLRGTVIAFQDYRFLEGTQFVGMDNFSRVIFSEAFWLAVTRTLLYTALSLSLGFITPVLLAILLHELPRGTVAFRVLYYLPALTTGIVVVFLWKSFYDPGPSGLINYLLSFARIAPQKWLDDPNLAMLCCVLPTVWAGIGAGSLIYLAALKSIPVELFEAASLDGCGFWKKVRHVAVPYLRPLMIINLVAVLIGTFQSAGYILVLTGGGPNDATNVVSLEIFYEAYARLSFGTATAMSWLLAFMLIGFTLFQIRYMARLEFRSAGTAG